MPEIFINYRSTDTAVMASNIEKAITEKFGAGVAYRDNSSIPPGVDFEPHLWNNLAVCKVILVLIGHHWLTPNVAGNTPLFAPKDFVRREIERANELNMHIVPVLVGGSADRLNADLLPDSIRFLASRQYRQIRDRDSDRDVAALMVDLADLLGRSGSRALRDGAPASPPGQSTGADIDVHTNSGIIATGSNSQNAIASGNANIVQAGGDATFYANARPTRPEQGA